MGRIRQFDREEVMDAALKEFWRQGYDRTSLDDLLKVMKIKNSSFYQAFGSKEKLFLDVLDRYRTTAVRERLGILLDDKLSARGSLEGYFHYIIYISSKKGFPIGCFMTNTVSSLVDPESAVGKEALKSMRKIEGNMRSVLERGVARKETFANLKPEQAARLLVTFLTGMTTMSRTKRSKKELMDNAVAMVDLLLKKED